MDLREREEVEVLLRVPLNQGRLKEANDHVSLGDRNS